MDPDKTARMQRLVWIHAGHKRTMLVLSWRVSFIIECHFALIIITINILDVCNMLVFCVFVEDHKINIWMNVKKICYMLNITK
jgi:hypothetical protein